MCCLPVSIILSCSSGTLTFPEICLEVLEGFALLGGRMVFKVLNWDGENLGSIPGFATDFPYDFRQVI